ncbi:outer membrane beta-barrel family protein [Abyssalbus ytuae]|uniref:Outer membrane beta-barrel family protein n=1 Tax=Abyssalbus ytuae TaxID=2926907 RepID=A0A9E6ZQR5_9FLAO|nr:outer membrane beta-barrel family protein [Abyssalbus ytuae]UOB17058.1 outer membrane beta-barrel family protein [Abyssalbus ytuae]
MISPLVFGQDLSRIGKSKLLTYSGGISANSVFYEGVSNRDPFTYVLAGNINFNISGIYNIPLSFTYSNQKFTNNQPFKFNRLSLHPSYKWVTAHIGDVAMTFSPYTLSGHQFTGLGFDITPNGPFKISAMYGRFLRAAEYEADKPQSVPAFERYGYGFKTSYDFKGVATVGLIFLSAKDKENSIVNPVPAELGLNPAENAVISLETRFSLFEKAKIELEYAYSGITRDTRLSGEAPGGLLSFILKENESTFYYKALRANFTYPAGNGSVGAGYERVDPGYRTFGAYFFNNDLENITVNASQAVFNGKLNISTNAGFQRDNLDNSKSSELQRLASAVNLNYTYSEKLSLTGSYSNFQSYTNIKDQFDYINQVSGFDNLDTLNYRQISQNATLGVNYVLIKAPKKESSVNFNTTYQRSDNRQNNKTIENGLSEFYNGVLSYTLGFPQQNLNISLAGNTSYNVFGADENLTLGPTLAIGKQFFDKKLKTAFSGSYNTSFNNGEKQNNVLNFRLGGNYPFLNNHNLSLNLMSLFRSNHSGNNNDFTATLSYTYNFSNFKLHLKKRPSLTTPQKSKPDMVSFRYRDGTYSGTLPEVTSQLNNTRISTRFSDIPFYKQDELKILFELVKEQEKAGTYKEKALTFLEELYSYEDFTRVYDKSVLAVVNKLKYDMQDVDYVLEKHFVDLKAKFDSHPLAKKDMNSLSEADKKNLPEYKKLKQKINLGLERMAAHRWMEKKIYTYETETILNPPGGLLKEFKEGHKHTAFKKFEETGDIHKVELYLEIAIIDFYYKKSLNEIQPENFTLRYLKIKE